MDKRVERVAEVLVSYSTCVKPGDWVVLNGEIAAEPLMKALYERVLEAGGYPQLHFTPSWDTYTLLSRGSDEQLAFVSPLTQLVVEKADVLLTILSSVNTRALTNVDPARRAQRTRAASTLFRTQLKRMGEGSLRWAATLYPTEGYAQEAEMSLDEYEDFVYGAGLVDEEDPVARWQEIDAQQQRLVDWLKERDQVHIRGSNIDLRLSVKGRTFLNASGKQNFPDGEIFTSPVETSATGWVNFTYPVVLQGQEVTGIRFEFKEGRVVKASADKNEASLLALLETDEGASVLGELGIGTNPGITRYTNNVLFDEKIQGTIHLAVGAGFPEGGGTNESSIHEDIVCDLRDGEIVVDGELFYRDGAFVVS